MMKLSLFLILSFVPAAQAALITYRDDNGTTHVVQSEDEIPEQYRGRKKKISGNRNDFEPGRTGLTKEGDSYYVMADFGAAGTHKMQIDLKVVYTTVSPAIQAALKLPKADKATIQTTFGKTGHYPMVIVPKMTVAGRVVENLKVIAAQDGLSGAAGRLGQSFFNAFNMKIDADRGELFLTPKKK